MVLLWWWWYSRSVRMHIYMCDMAMRVVTMTKEAAAEGRCMRRLAYMQYDERDIIVCAGCMLHGTDDRESCGPE